MMPASIVTVYAAFNLVPKFAPSYFMTAVDPFLSPMVLFNLIDAYVPVLSAINGEKRSDMNWSTSFKTGNAHSLCGTIKSYVKWLLPVDSNFDHLGKRREIRRRICATLNAVSPDNAWFACEKEELLKRIEKFNNLFEHPYLSSIKYKKFAQLTDVELHLITPLFDPLHDDSIEMAKKWKGTSW